MKEFANRIDNQDSIDEERLHLKERKKQKQEKTYADLPPVAAILVSSKARVIVARKCSNGEATCRTTESTTNAV